MARTDVIGAMRKRLVLQRDEPKGKNTAGEPIANWVNVFKNAVWGSVEPLSSRELLNGAQMQADITHKIRIRYRADLDLTADMRILLGDRVFNIMGPPRDIEERHQFWEMLAIEAK